VVFGAIETRMESMMDKPDDAIIVLRDVMRRRRQITVTAERNDPQRTWHVVGRVDGALHDTAQSDDPEGDGTADRMLAEIDREFH
jgi:porphobilinogen deaminase